MENQELIINKIIENVGGINNISLCINCMTRLRITLFDQSKINIEELKKIPTVLGVNEGEAFQIIVGPGKSTKYQIAINEILSKTKNNNVRNKDDSKMSIDSSWKENKAKQVENRKFKKISECLKRLANIFTPLIPAIIAAGLFAALSSIIRQTGGTITGDKWTPNNDVVNVFYNICEAFSKGFTTYLVIFVGVNAAKEFKTNMMLGGFIGGICSIGNITEIAKLIHLYDEKNPLQSVLMTGKGGVIGVIIAVYLLSIVERFFHKKLPNSLDTVFTPFLSILIVGTIYVFGIMIGAGFISDGITWLVAQLTNSSHLIVRIIAGFLSASLFLPLVMTGMHHGLVALYATELSQVHYVSLYPVLAMAGAGQVGAAIALYIKAKKVNNTTLKTNITGSILPGILGVGEPLIYSVTLPLGTPFITAGLGAGIGGALLMAFRVGSTAWGPSGVMAIPLMTYLNGKENMFAMLVYSIGIVISIVFGFIFTWFTIKNSKLQPTKSI